MTYLDSGQAERRLRAFMLRTLALIAGVLIGVTIYSAMRPVLTITSRIAMPTPPEPTTPAEWIAVYANADGVPWQVALALAKDESGLRPDARNGHDCGVMQLDERVFPGACGMTSRENVRAGVAYLGFMMLQCAGPQRERELDEHHSSLAYIPQSDGFIDLGPSISYSSAFVVRGRVGGCAVDRYRGKKR